MVADSTFEGFEDLVRRRHTLSLDSEIREGFKRMSRGKDPDPDPRPIYERVAALPNKTLLLWGRDDRFCAIDDAFLYLGALRDSRLMIFPATGHWVQVERRAEFATYVATFLST
jgi:2-hydroxy-6-oxonona-2,4-dienedioate hydrolase/4,5:9,10-diseco-3-hydroxy-5,9,17-trioxoandrosta-1(10),2-diene-4-oate hydrolase